MALGNDSFEFSSKLEFHPDVWDPSQLPPDIEDFVVRHGTSQEGRPVPVGWGQRRSRTPHRCYLAAGANYLSSNCLCTEGRALSATGGKWIPHAWLTDPEGEVIDLSWPEPGIEYFGVELPDEIAGPAALRLGLFGPLLPVVLHEMAWSPTHLPAR